MAVAFLGTPAAPAARPAHHRTATAIRLQREADQRRDAARAQLLSGIARFLYPYVAIVLMLLAWGLANGLIEGMH